MSDSTVYGLEPAHLRGWRDCQLRTWSDNITTYAPTMSEAIIIQDDFANNLEERWGPQIGSDSRQGMCCVGGSGMSEEQATEVVVSDAIVPKRKTNCVE